MLETNRKIHLLPEHIIDQIKAGEVIERPANIIKELLENSIDAKSTQIKIHIIENGLELIQVEDNGVGIEFDDLPYAFLRHATSKIESFDDIYKLYTYGFRGEALASIGAISRVKCITSTDKETSQLSLEGSEVTSHIKNHDHSPRGTVITIKDLFFNTPARLKFVQSKTSERNRLNKIINSFLVARPEIEFHVKFDDKEKKIYPAADKTTRLKQVIGKRNNGELLHIENEYDHYRADIFISLSSNRSPSSRQQYILINDRFVIDKKIHNILVNNCGKIWPFGNQGDYIVSLTLPPEAIDVNVHPNKTMIKFLKPAQVFTLVSSTLKNFFQENSFEQESQNDFSGSSQNETETPINMSDFMEGNQFKDLKNIPSGQFHQTNLFEETQSNLIAPTDQYIIFQNNLKYFIFDKLAYVGNSIQEEWEAEIDIIPLIISEPFKLGPEHDQKLEQLLELGLEFDRLDPSTVALRTIPSSFQRIDYKTLLEHSLFDLPKEDQIQNHLLKNLKVNMIRLKTNQIIKATEESFTKLIEKNICKQLENSNLKKLFK